MYFDILLQKSTNILLERQNFLPFMYDFVLIVLSLDRVYEALY